MKRLTQVDAPLNAIERYLYAIIQRLDLLIEMNTPKVEVIAPKEEKVVQVTAKDDIIKKEETITKPTSSRARSKKKQR